jgi:hypothetical protein
VLGFLGENRAVPQSTLHTHVQVSRLEIVGAQRNSRHLDAVE